MTTATTTSERHHVVYGRRFRVLATFPDTAAGQRDANRFMTEHEHAALLATEGGTAILADTRDKGEPINSHTK